MNTKPKKYVLEPIWQAVIRRPGYCHREFPYLPGSDPEYGSYRLVMAWDGLRIGKSGVKENPHFIELESKTAAGNPFKKTLVLEEQDKFDLEKIPNGTDMTISILVFREESSEMKIIKSIQDVDTQLEDPELASELKRGIPPNGDECDKENDDFVTFFLRGNAENGQETETRTVRTSLLANNIDYFRAMFSFQNVTEHVHLKGLSAHSFDILINFLISGRKTLMNERREYLVELFQFAQMAVIPDVQIVILRKAIVVGDSSFLKELLHINVLENSPLSAFMQRHILAQLC